MSTRCDDIDILQVIEKCGVQTFHKSGNEYGLYDSGRKTAGWSVNIEKKVVKDFSNKDRADSGSFGFVKKHNNFSDHETYLWFEENFPNKKPTDKKSILEIWNGFSEINDSCKDYLKGRGIEYEKIKHLVKDYKGSIACMVHAKGMPSGITARTLSKDKKYRFTAYPGYSTVGLYQGKLNKEEKDLYVVEGLIDFLTIRQYTTNVVGLKSAESGLKDVERLSKTYNIIFIFDNDEAGRNTRKKLNIKYKYYNWNCIEEYSNLKDVNDLHKEGGEITLDFIKDNLISDTPISRTIEKFKERQKIIKERGKLGVDGPYCIYDHTHGVVAGKVYTIGAFSNVGKSKFAYANASWFLQQGYKVLFVSIEESEEDMFGNFLATMTNTSLYKLGDAKINEKIFENLVVVDSAKNTKDIDNLVKLHKPNMVFIDYVQGLGNSSYEKQSKIALDVQQIAIQNKVTVFSISQLSNASMRTIGEKGLRDCGNIVLKGAGEYYSASDVIFVLARNPDIDGQLNLLVEKNKLGRRGLYYDLDVVWSYNSFNITENTEEQDFYSNTL